VLAVTLLATQLAGADLASAAPGCPGQSQYNSFADVSGEQRPVVMVHGWNSSSSSMTDVERALTASGATTSGRAKPLYFDYRSETTHWASLPQIAACLADFVHEVSAKYDDAGGDGRVVVVAHSMGGLAARFAASGKYTANPITPAQLLGVVTLGTPSLGSPFGGLSPWSQVSQLIERLNEHDRLGVFESRDQGSDGGTCLAAHSKPDHRMPPKCAVAPYLPTPFRMSQIAGDATIDRGLFGIHLYDIPLFSDGVVPVPSAHGYVASAPGDAPYGGYTDSAEVRCSTGFDGVWSAMMAGIITAGGLSLKSPALARLATRSAISLVNDFETFANLQNDDMGLGLAAFLGYTTLRSSCGHVNLTRDRASLDAMVRMVAAHLDSGPERPTGAVTLGLGGTFDGTGLFAPEAEVMSFLIGRLGEPDDVADGGMCEAGGPAGRRVTWEDLTVLFVDDGAAYLSGSQPALDVQGPIAVGWEYWRIKTGADRLQLRTEEGLGLGAPLSDVRAAYPDAEVGEDYAGVYARVFRGDFSGMTFTFADDALVAISSGGGCGE
jgi:pimeloyl-ACP methyl ester carboxylesterase